MLPDPDQAIGPAARDAATRTGAVPSGRTGRARTKASWSATSCCSTCRPWRAARPRAWPLLATSVCSVRLRYRGPVCASVLVWSRFVVGLGADDVNRVSAALVPRPAACAPVVGRSSTLRRRGAGPGAADRGIAGHRTGQHPAGRHGWPRGTRSSRHQPARDRAARCRGSVIEKGHRLALHLDWQGDWLTELVARFRAHSRPIGSLPTNQLYQHRAVYS
jgi:hypothetical protein